MIDVSDDIYTEWKLSKWEELVTSILERLLKNNMTIGQISEQTLDQCDVHNVDKCTEYEGEKKRVRRERKEGKKERDSERERGESALS